MPCRFVDLAAKAGKLEAVVWLHRNRAEGCTFRSEAWPPGGGGVASFCTEEAMDGACITTEPETA